MLITLLIFAVALTCTAVGVVVYDYFDRIKDPGGPYRG